MSIDSNPEAVGRSQNDHGGPRKQKEVKIMKKLVLFALALCVASSLTYAQNLLLNGDFSLGSNGTTDPDTQALDWTHYWTAGWINREQNANGTYGDPLNYHYAIGNAGAIDNGIYQSVVVPDDGATYQLTVDMGMDNWWKPDAFLKIEFKDALDGIISFEQTQIQAAGYDGGVGQPWASRSVIGTAPAGTALITVVLGATGEGGTARWDNAVLTTVVPEPTTGAFLALGSLVLLGYRSRRNS